MTTDSTVLNKQKNTRIGIIVWGLLAAVAWMAYTIRQERLEFLATSHWSNPEWNASALEFEVSTTTSPNLSTSSVTVKHGSKVRTDWSFVENNQWFVINPYEATALCRDLFRGLLVNMPSQPIISVDQLNVWISSSKDKKSTVQAFIPTFKAEPTQLAACPGFSYNAVSQRLNVGDKDVAILMNLTRAY